MSGGYGVSTSVNDVTGSVSGGDVRVRTLSEGDIIGVQGLRSVVRWLDDPEAFELLRGMRDARWAVAEESGGRLIGMVGAVPLGRIGVLCHLAVGEDHRGTGIGTSLASWAVSYLRSRGVDVIRLYSTPIARNLYASLGFRETGRKSTYGRTGHIETSSGAGCRIEEMTFGDLPEVYGQDYWSCGLDRSHIIIATLRMRPGFGLTARDASGRMIGYLVRSDSASTTRIGPILASGETTETADALLSCALKDTRNHVEIGASDSCGNFLDHHGFTRYEHLDKIRMELRLDESAGRDPHPSAFPPSGFLRQYATTSYLST